MTDSLGTGTAFQNYIKEFGNLDKATQQAILSSGLLSKAQKEQLISQMELSASTTTLTAEQIKERVATELGSDADAKALLVKSGIVTEKELETGATIEVTTAKLEEAVANGTLSVSDAAVIAGALGIAKANTTTTASFGLLTKALWANIKAIGTWLLTTPAGWATLATGALVGLVAVVEKLTINIDEASESLEESKSNYDSISDEINTLSDELSTCAKRMKELQDIGSLRSVVEDSELQDLQASNEELTRRLAILKEEQRLAAIEVANDASQTLNSNVQSEYDTGYYSGTKRGKSVSISEELQLAIDAYDEYAKKKAEIDEQLLKDPLNTELAESSELYQSQMDEAAKRANEMAGYINQTEEAYKAIIDNGGTLTSTQQAEYNSTVTLGNAYLDFAKKIGSVSTAYEDLDTTEKAQTLKDKYAQRTLSLPNQQGSYTVENKEISDWIDTLSDEDLTILATLNFSGEQTKESMEDALEYAKTHTDSDLQVDGTSILSEDRISELEEQAGQLSSIISEIQSSYNTLQSAIEEYNEQGYLSLDTLDSLMSLDNEYLACLVNENGQLSLNADAMNALAQSKLNEAEASAVAEAMTELQAIANGEAASSTANYISGNASLMQSLALLAGQYDNVASAAMTAAQAQELSAMIEAANAKDSAATARVMSGLNSRLGLIRSASSSIRTRGIGGSSSKKSGGGGSSSSKDAWKEEFQAQYDLLKHNLEMEYITEEQYYSALNALNEKYFANNAKYTDEYRKYQEEVYKGMQKVYKEYIENNMSYLEKALDANKISFGHYSNAVKKMLEDMWHDGKISASDYWSYVEKMLEKQLDIYDATLSAVTTLLDDEIDKIQEEIDALEDKNDALNDQLEIYDSALSAIEKVYDDEIQNLEDQKQAIQDVIDAMQEENDERERAMALQQAQYNLNRALSQNANYIYKDGQFVYTTDQTAIREAQDSLHEAQYNIDIAELQKQQDALDDYIDVLNSFKSMWQEIAEAYQTAQDSMNATAILGQNYAQIVLSNNISDIENFKNQYVEIQSQINSNDELIASYEEKIEYYQALKDQWSSITSAYEDAQNRIYAAEILGANWEQDVLSGRIDVLNNFRNQYVSLQQQMADAAVASANAIIEANNRIAESTASASASVSNGGGSGGSSGGGGGSTTTTTTPTAPVWSVIQNGTNAGLYSGTKSECTKYIERNNYSIVREDSTHHRIYVTPKGNTGGRPSSGGGNRNMAYASGTTNAKKGLNLVGEEGTETYIDNDGNVSLVTAPSLINMDGGETVKNAKETEELLNPNNFVPIETMELPGLNGTILKLSSDEFRERITKAMPSYSSMVESSIQTPRYDAIPVNRNNNATITQQVTFHCPNLTDKSGIEYVERELRSLATKAMQFDWSK